MTTLTITIITILNTALLHYYTTTLLHYYTTCYYYTAITIINTITISTNLMLYYEYNINIINTIINTNTKYVINTIINAMFHGCTNLPEAIPTRTL